MREQILSLLTEQLDRLSKEDQKRLLTRQAEFKAGLEPLVLSLAAEQGELPEHQIARKIMGERFLGIPENETHLGPVTDEQQEALAEIPFTRKTLNECAETHVLVADTGNRTAQTLDYLGREPDMHRRRRYYPDSFAEKRKPNWWLITTEQAYDTELLQQYYFWIDSLVPFEVLFHLLVLYNLVNKVYGRVYDHDNMREYLDFCHTRCRYSGHGFVTLKNRCCGKPDDSPLPVIGRGDSRDNSEIGFLLARYGNLEHWRMT